MNWKIGQKLVCLKKGQWRAVWSSGKETPTNGPKYMEIVTFLGMNHVGQVLIDGYRYKNSLGQDMGFDPIQFRPLLGESARTELISYFVEVTETSDCPIKIEEPCS